MTTVNSIFQRIQPNQYNKGSFRQSEIEILPIQVGKVRAAVTSLGGNIVMFEVGSDEDRFSVTPCFLDLDQADLPRFLKEESNRTMGNIGGLTPAMSPVGRTTHLHREGESRNIVAEMIALPGQRSLSSEVAIHGVLHNRLWKMEDLETDTQGNAKVKVTFTVSESENADLYKIFGPGEIERTYTFKDNQLILFINDPDQTKHERDIGRVDISTKITGWHNSFGDHSFFNIPGDGWTLEAPSQAKLNVDTENHRILTGEITSGNFYTSSTPIAVDDAVYTDLSIIWDPKKRRHYTRATLKQNILKREIEITSYHGSGEPFLSHRTIFTPLDAHGNLKSLICIEPSTASPDMWKMSSLQRRVRQADICSKSIALHQRIVVRTNESRITNK